MFRFFENLPDEIVSQIIGEASQRGQDISVEEIAKLSLVDKRFNSIINDDQFQFVLYSDDDFAIKGNLEEYKKYQLHEELTIHVACSNVDKYHLEKIKELLSLEIADVNYFNYNCGSLLRTAVKVGSYEVAAYLLEKSAKLDLADGRETLIDDAIWYHQVTLNCIPNCAPDLLEQYKNQAAQEVRTIELLKDAMQKKQILAANIKAESSSLVTTANTFFALRSDITTSEAISGHENENKPSLS